MNRSFSSPFAGLKAIPGYAFLRRAHRRLKRLGARDQQWLRVVMDEATYREVANLSPERRCVLEISGTQWRDRFTFASYQSVSYPEFDICEQRLDRKFDLIIAEQVFEHLRRPYRAARNVYEMLAPGGVFLITTPFLVRRHDMPDDCTRWTDSGLRYFLSECGFDLDKVRASSWGNRACLRANFFDWPLYRPIIHSLRNERDFPLCVWAVAVK